MSIKRPQYVQARAEGETGDGGLETDAEFSMGARYSYNKGAKPQVPAHHHHHLPMAIPRINQ